MIYLLYKIGQFLAFILPLKLTYRIAEAIGNLYYLLAKRDRKIVTDNIRVVLNYTNNSRPIGKVSRRVFVNFGRYLVEFFRTPKITSQYIKEHIKIEGRENLDQALRLGKGVLLLSAHLGNWELGAAVLSMLGYKINIVAWTHKNKLVSRFFVRQRQGKGIKIIPLGAGIRKVFAALKINELVAVLADVDYLNPQAGIRVRFFGRDAIMPKGPAAFALKVACPVVPIFVLREKRDTFRLILRKAIMYNATGNREQDLIGLTEKISRTMESHIGLYPEQWFMLTARWPDNNPKVKNDK